MERDQLAIQPVDLSPGTAVSSTAEPDPAPMPFPHILCCLDDSPQSQLALHEAQRLRALSPGTLSLLHVAPMPLMYDDVDPALVDPRDIHEIAKRWLGDQVARAPGATGVLLTGHAPAVVCDWATHNTPDVIVVAPHHGLRERIFIGSFVAYLLRHSPSPVLVVRPRSNDQAPIASGTPYSHIACCVDHSAPSAAGLALARRIRASGPGQLTALNAAFLPPQSDMFMGSYVLSDVEEYRRSAEVWLRGQTAEMSDVQAVSLYGYPATTCADWANANGCDLMVAAAHRGMFERVLLGSFAGYLAQHAPCSLLVTRPAIAVDARSTIGARVATGGNP